MNGVKMRKTGLYWAVTVPCSRSQRLHKEARESEGCFGTTAALWAKEAMVYLFNDRHLALAARNFLNKPYVA